MTVVLPLPETPLVTIHLTAPDGGDCGADESPGDLVEREHGGGAVVVGCFDPRVGGVGGEIGVATRFEIHGKEGDVASHIDPAEGGVEFDRVEGDELSL